MDGNKLIRAIYEQFNDRLQPDQTQRAEMREEMIDILNDEDDVFAANGVEHLRKFALEYTDLVEPSDE